MTYKKSLDTNPYTLEHLIEGLDERGMLVLNVLIGQQAMALLSKSKIKEVVGSGKILTPEGKPTTEGISA